MPIARFQMPDGRIARFEVPEGTTPEQAQSLIASSLNQAESPRIETSSKPIKIGADAYQDTLRDTLQGVDWGTRQIASAGTSLSNLWEGVKQFVGAEDKGRIRDNRIIREEAPVGAIVGDVVLTAVPFGLAGNSVKAAGVVGAGYGLTQPIEANSTGEVVKGKLLNTALGGATGAGGQVVANKVGDLVSKRVQALADKKKANAVIDSTLSEARQAGYVVPPSMMPDSGVASRILEGVSGKYKTNQLAGIRNQAVTDDLARQAVGLGKNDELTSEAMQQIRNQAYSKGYEPVTGIGEIATDETYKKTLESIVSKYQGAAKSFPGAVSDDVTSAILGKTSGGKPDAKAWVDSFGQIVDDASIPKAPTMRSLVYELKQSGGLNPSELADLGVEQVNKSAPGFLNKNGKTMDSVVEWMEGHGWLSPQQIAMAEKDGVGGSHELARDMIRGALAKEDVVHPHDADAYYAFYSKMRDLQDQGVKQVVIPGAKGKTEGGLAVDKFDSADAIKMIQILRDESSKAYAQGDKGLGKAKKEAAKAIEDQIERSLFAMGQKGGDLLKNFREARTLMAKTHTVEDAIREGAGSVNAKSIGGKLQRGKPLTGELATIGRFANNFGDVAGLPKSGHANPFTIIDAGYSLGGGALNPLAYALPLARVGARYGLLSEPAQKAISAASYEMSPALRMGGGLLGYSPIGGTVLGLNALGQ